MSAPLYRYWLSTAWHASSRALVRAEGDEAGREAMLDLRERLKRGLEIVLPCQLCGRPFEARNRFQRFCAQRCTHAAYKAEGRLALRLARRSA